MYDDSTLSIISRAMRAEQSWRFYIRKCNYFAKRFRYFSIAMFHISYSQYFFYRVANSRKNEKNWRYVKKYKQTWKLWTSDHLSRKFWQRCYQRQGSLRNGKKWYGWLLVSTRFNTKLSFCTDRDTMPLCFVSSSSHLYVSLFCR